MLTAIEWQRELDSLADYAARRRGFMILADGQPLDHYKAAALGGYDAITVYRTHIEAKNEIHEHHNANARIGLPADTREFTIVRVMYPEPGEIVPPSPQSAD